MIQQVMLAEQYQPSEAIFPYLATPKIDGIRFYVHGGHLWTRSNKSVPNYLIQQALRDIFPDGVDGELFAGGTFNTSQSLVMSDAKPLEDTKFVVHIFDLFSPENSYIERIDKLHALSLKFLANGWIKTKGGFRKAGYPFKIKFLFPMWVQNHAAVETYYESCLAAGYEGIILRCPDSKYVFGRSKLMLKYKPYVDREAVILGCEEMMTNTNEEFTDELGRTKRSSAEAGKVPAGILGKLHVMDIQNEVKFHVGNGPGLTHILRAHLWSRRFDLPGLIIKYKCLAYGQKEKPRMPQFLGFRDPRDL